MINYIPAILIDTFIIFCIIVCGIGIFIPILEKVIKVICEDKTILFLILLPSIVCLLLIYMFSYTDEKHESLKQFCGSHSIENITFSSPNIAHGELISGDLIENVKVVYRNNKWYIMR